jgi:hypothetical protein
MPVAAARRALRTRSPRPRRCSTSQQPPWQRRRRRVAGEGVTHSTHTQRRAIDAEAPLLPLRGNRPPRQRLLPPPCRAVAMPRVQLSSEAVLLLRPLLQAAATGPPTPRRSSTHRGSLAPLATTHLSPPPLSPLLLGQLLVLLLVAATAPRVPAPTCGQPPMRRGPRHCPTRSRPCRSCRRLQHRELTHGLGLLPRLALQLPPQRRSSTARSQKPRRRSRRPRQCRVRSPQQ